MSLCFSEMTRQTLRAPLKHLQTRPVARLSVAGLQAAAV